VSVFPFDAGSEQIVADAVRGRRLLRQDAHGRLVEVVRADGEPVRIEYDQAGAVRRLDAQDVRIDTELKPAEHPLLRVTDDRGRTDVDITADGWWIARGGAELRLEKDSEGRPDRIFIPGSAYPLEFTYTSRGCELSYGGRTLARLRVEDWKTQGRRRWRIGPVLLEEHREAARWTLTACTRKHSERRHVVIWTDLLGRTIRRSGDEGFEERFRRDAEGRLIEHRRVDGENCCDHEFHYRGGQLVETTGTEGRTVREIDEGGRVLSLNRPDGVTIRCEYDPRGRRTTRHAPDGITRYSYDGLDRLVRVETPDRGIVEYRYDGLCRRIETRGPEGIRIEHRDAGGRLWAVADASGRTLETYVWYDDRPLLRFDGPLGSARCTAYLCDPLGTAFLAATIDGGRVVRIERLDAPLYGSVERPHPTVFGHFADPAARLIHFGARDLDPETGTFLTPDPWHGGADDERRWAGGAPGDPGWIEERVAGERHAYAACGFDPAGRADYDGHVSGGAIGAAILRGFGNLILGPTWGMPLTSISLFFFLPFNIWAEIVAGIVAIFIQRHPWKNHSIFGSALAQGSLRQGQLSFALNGFLPRVISGGGITADRAVTIGNVLWISRHELNVLNRPLTVDIDDLASPAPFNQDTSKVSVVALELTDKKGKLQVHSTYWTRGYGNAIKSVGAAPNTKLAFDDRAVNGKRPATLMLAHPVPFGYPAPSKTTDNEKLRVRELVHDSATHAKSDATIVDDVKFALKLEQNKKEKLKDGNAIEIEAETVPDAAQMVIGKVQNTDDFSLLFLFGEIPARFNAVTKEMTVWRIVDDTSRAATDGWEDAGSAKVLEAPDPGAGKPWPPPLEKGDLVKIKAGTAAAAIATVGFPVPLSRDTSHGRIKKLIATLDVAEALPAGLGATTDVLLVNGTGTVQNAKLKDKAKDAEIEFVADPDDIAQGDRVSVRLTGTATETYATIATLNGKAATLTYLAAKPAYAGPTDLQVRKLVDRTADDDPKGTAASPTGTSFGVEVPRFASFPKDALVHLKSGAVEAIRKIDKMPKARIELADEVLGAKPFTVSLAKRDPDLCRIKDVERPALKRFLKHTGGADPHTYHSYPDYALEVSPDLTFPMLSKFYVQGAGNLADGYRLTWSPIEFGGDKYFVLDSDLPINEDIKTPNSFNWMFDPDESDYHAFRFFQLGAKPAGGFRVKVREFNKSGVERANATAHAAEVLVPADPQFRYTFGESLSEHELHHTLQGNYYGPFLGALPLQAMILNVTDLAEISDDVHTPTWFRDIHSEGLGGNIGLSAWQTFSIGGIMFFAWKSLFTWPLLFSKDSQDAILKSNFESWNRLFNPFWGNLIHKFPKLDPNLSQRNSDPGEVIARLIARAMDLRSWTPFLGLVPTWLPDGPQNFIEQGASRMSGDLYSSILSTDDKFNAKLSMRIGDSLVRDDHGADVEKAHGSAFRVMTYPGDRWERIFRFDRADQPAEPDCPVVYNTEFGDQPLVSITAPADTLFHPELYDLAAAGTLSIEGPNSNPALVDFKKMGAGAGAAATPRIRSLIPLPPRVDRTGGMYFIPSQPAVYDCETFDSNAGKPKDALTQKVKLTVSGSVKLDDQDVAWATPPAHPALPAAAPIDRFVTEKAILTMKDHKGHVVETAGYEERKDVTAGAAAKSTITKGNDQWEIVVGDTAATLRIRLYRVFKKNDPADDTKNDPAFDLMFDSIDSLKNVRSYLEKDTWVPVRDFLIDVKALPPLPPQTAKYDAFVDVPLPLKVAASAIAITPPAGAPRLNTPEDRGKDPNPANPRGQIWRFGPLGKVVEAAAVYKVEVSFGEGAVTQKAGFDLTIEPIITLTGGGAFEASKGSPLDLAINAGTPAFSLNTESLPAGTAAQLDSPNRKVTITVNDAPAAATKAVITVTDSNGKKGKRTITVK
jgi:YD repeat-containing protein